MPHSPPVRGPAAATTKESPTPPIDEPLRDLAAEPEPVSVPTPINVRSASLALLAVLACVHALHWASAVFIPLLLGLMVSYALSPAVDRLQRWRVPRALAAAGEAQVEHRLRSPHRFDIRTRCSPRFGQIGQRGRAGVGRGGCIQWRERSGLIGMNLGEP